MGDIEQQNMDLKRALAQAYCELQANKEQKEADGETWKPATYSYAPDVQSRIDALKQTAEIGKEALDLESVGIPYSVALKIAEATHDGDYEGAARLLQIHEKNERTIHAAEIAEQEEETQLRKVFGLR